MQKLIIALISLSLLSCQGLTSGLTKKEFESKIIAAEKSNIVGKKLVDGWYETVPTENEFRRIDEKTSRSYFINPKPIVLPDNFSKGEEFVNYEGAEGLAIYFEKAAVEAWANATDKNTGLYLIFILDDKILSTPYINSKITKGVSAFWKNNLTEEQWNRIKNMVKKK